MYLLLILSRRYRLRAKRGPMIKLCAVLKDEVQGVEIKRPHAEERASQSMATSDSLITHTQQSHLERGAGLKISQTDYGKPNIKSVPRYLAMPLSKKPPDRRSSVYREGYLITLRYLWNIAGFAGSSGAQRRKESVENTVRPCVIRAASFPPKNGEVAPEAFADTSCVAHTDKDAGPKLYSTKPPTAKIWYRCALAPVPSGLMAVHTPTGQESLDTCAA
jgi:hypothetical protein